MFIIGNGSGQKGDLNRGLWVSRPIDPSNPNGWISNLQRVGDVSLPGNRESQLVALQGGGFMFVGATDNGPVSAITAATPQGLINAEHPNPHRRQTRFRPSTDPPSPACPSIRRPDSKPSTFA